LTLAFATCARQPGIDPDDAPLASALAARGIDVEPVVWDAPGVDWSRFDAVVIRSTWDYHHHRRRFLAWAEQVDTRSTLVNALGAVRWNTHKRYLRDLETRGIDLVPTAWVDARTLVSLPVVVDQMGWDLTSGSFVLKPAVSAGAHDAMVFDGTTLRAAQAHLEAITQNGDAMVQPYVGSVEAYGERSLVFFDGHFSHAVRKCPALGGDDADKPMVGQERAVTPTDAELLFAASVLHAAADFTPPPVYARVDIVHDGATRLMELELVEPTLFLLQNPGSEARFAAALERFAARRG
jgi:hypothetical protein